MHLTQTYKPMRQRLDVLQAAMAAEGGTWTTDRAAQVLADAGLSMDRNSAWGLLRMALAEVPTAEDQGSRRLAASRPAVPVGANQLDLFGGTA